MPKIQTSSDRHVDVHYSRAGVLYLSIVTADGQSISTRMTPDAAADLVEVIDDAIDDALAALEGRDEA